MGARLEGHEEGAATRPITGLGQRSHFRMGATVGGVIALSGGTTLGIEESGQFEASKAETLLEQL